MKEQNITTAAAKVARGAGLKIEDLIGTGQNGRVLKSDVEEYESEPPFSPQR